MEIIYENTKDKEIILSTGPLIPTQLTSIIDTKSSLRAEMLYELFIQGKIRSEIQYEKIRLEGKEKILEIKGTHSPDSISKLKIIRLAFYFDESRQVYPMWRERTQW